MRGSWRVQSALSATTPRDANSFTTAALFNATRLLTWQVTHQAAVKSTNTGLPAAVSSRTFSGLHACHASSPGFALCASVAGFGLEEGHATAIPAMAKSAATAERHGPRSCSQRPNIHADIAMK